MNETNTTVGFDDAQLAMLNRLMDQFIPASPDGRMPSAASLALFADTAGLPTRAFTVLVEGLAALDERAGSRYGRGFAGLPAAELATLVQALRDEGSAFIDTFTLHTVGRYLQHDEVMPQIGLEARPPWPKGNEVAQGDWSLIEVVKQRPKIYRDV